MEIDAPSIVDSCEEKEGVSAFVAQLQYEASVLAIWTWARHSALRLR